MNRAKASRILSAAVAATLLHSPVANAALEEIIVTARKREEPLQKTPVSITAFTVRPAPRAGWRERAAIQRFSWTARRSNTLGT